MRYISTRGGAPPVSFLEAMLAGLAPDGGLYVPAEWPLVFEGEQGARIAACAPFNAVSLFTLRAFVGELWEESGAIVNAAYVGDFDNPDWRPHWPASVTPLTRYDAGAWLLELYHGPSLSFKDVAMQLIGPLYEYALRARGKRLTVLCATSGDTGGAAVEALKNRERMDLFVLTPKGRVSEVQRRFMTTSGAANVHAIEIDGDFDTCQAITKAIFNDHAFAASASLSGVNSINWARIAAQSAYFHASAHALCGPGLVNFVVPTGNFGDAYSGWVAKRMGAPIGRIVLAVNENDILARAIVTGRYERAAHSRATLSPAMDIQVASNFERILFEALGRDAEQLRRLYAQFDQSGGFDIPPDALANLREDFYAISVDDEDTARMMTFAWSAGHHGALVCPHTAVGLLARAQLANELGLAPTVVLATAHPAKFPETVESATGVRPPLPLHCADLYQRAEKFDTLPADAEAVKAYIRERTRAWA